MSEVIKRTCIVCPVGCSLEIVKDPASEEGYTVSGNNCIRGHVYGIKEMTNPTRVVTSTVRVRGRDNIMLPVKTTEGIPKEKMIDFMEDLNKVSVELPVKRNDILIEDIYGSGINLVATKSMN